MTATLTPGTTRPAPRRRAMPGWARAALWVAVAVVAVSYTSYATGLPELTASGTVQSAVRLGVPILLAGLGGLWAERAGVINICLLYTSDAADE